MFLNVFAYPVWYRRNVTRWSLFLVFTFCQKRRDEGVFSFFFIFSFSMISVRASSRPLPVLAPSRSSPPLLRRGAPSSFARRLTVAMVKTESQDVTVGEFKLPDFEVSEFFDRGHQKNLRRSLPFFFLSFLTSSRNDDPEPCYSCPLSPAALSCPLSPAAGFPLLSQSTLVD